MVAHSRSVHTVTQRGRAATLDVAQNGGTGVDTGAGLDLIGDLLRVADALGHDDDEVALAGALSLDDLIEDVALHIEFLLGQQHGHSAGGDGDVQSNVTSVAAHDLDDAAAVMALGGVAQLVDHLQSSVHSGIVTDGVVGAGNIVVDGAGQADHRDAAVCQLTGAAVRTVAADDHQRVNAQLTALGCAFILALFGLELKAACGVEDGAAGRDDVRDTAQVHFEALAVQQTVIAALDADHAEALVQAGTDHGTDSCVHAGGVAAAGENTDRLDLLFHREIPSNLFLHIPLGARASPSSTDAARLDATYLLWLALDKYITKLII